LLARIVLILTLVALPGCGGGEVADAPETAEQERLKIVAAFYPLAYAAELIGGGAVAVTNLTPIGAEPHDVELTARDVERIHSADVVLYLGEGFQPALERVLEGSGTRAVDLLEGLELREEEPHRDGHEDEIDSHAAEDGREAERPVDPHVWLDPLRFAAIVKRIGLELGQEDRAAETVSELDVLHAEFEQGLADCTRREIVTLHTAFGYLAERYDLRQISIAGLSPEAEPSARDLERVIDEVREHGATTVFSEVLASPRLAETVAREAGARTAVLNPIEGLSRSAAADGAEYFSLMRENLAVLREALGCR
jgi:zinc transport system substrate-binding protein